MTTFFQGGTAMQMLTENDFIDEKELERERQNLNKIIAQVKEKLL